MESKEKKESMKHRFFEFLEHTADIKIKLYGITLQEVFENGVLAFADYVSSSKNISSNKGKVIDVKGDDTSSLLYNFFDELIYLIDAEHFITAKASITLRGNNLHAELYGDSTDKYNLKQVKAATYAEMSVEKKRNGWEAIVVLDV